MTRLRAVLGYALAALAVPILLATFVGMEEWAGLLASATGVTISPWFSGGEVARFVEHGGYRTAVHRPVFDALIGQRPAGFVQIDWAPAQAVPERIDEEVDLDGDALADLRVRLDTRTGKAEITPYSSRLIALVGSYRLKGAWAVRVSLRNAPPGGR